MEKRKEELKRPSPSVVLDENIIEAIYLGVLTARKLKPVSIIEYPVPEAVTNILKNLNLRQHKIKLTSMKNSIEILIISKEHNLLDSFKKEFDNMEVIEFQSNFMKLGEYFGIPFCCRGEHSRMKPNGFTAEEQKLLFYWACPNCKATKKILPLYRKAWQETNNIIENFKEHGGFTL